MSTLYPLRLQPAYKDYLWGGDRIPRLFGRKLPPGVYAESWEVADRPEGMGVVTSGPLAGRTLHDLVTTLGPALLGDRVDSTVFPLLIKLIDAKETLSVQVHPNNEAAARHGGEPKTEMWYILAAEPDACVYCGLRPGVTREMFERGVKENALEEMLVRVPVKADDAIFVPGGRVHAIGAGCLLLECQQNSNTTYRIYDWGRVGADGKPRELHLQQALKVIHWADHEPPLVPQRLIACTSRNEHWEVLTSPYFRMERYVAGGNLVLRAKPDSFRALFVQDGVVELEQDGFRDTVAAGTTLLIPASCSELTVRPSGETASFITMSVP